MFEFQALVLLLSLQVWSRYNFYSDRKMKTSTASFLYLYSFCPYYTLHNPRWARAVSNSGQHPGARGCHKYACGTSGQCHMTCCTRWSPTNRCSRHSQTLRNGGRYSISSNITWRNFQNSNQKLNTKQILFEVFWQRFVWWENKALLVILWLTINVALTITCMTSKTMKSRRTPVKKKFWKKWLHLWVLSHLPPNSSQMCMVSVDEIEVWQFIDLQS